MFKPMQLATITIALAFAATALGGEKVIRPFDGKSLDGWNTKQKSGKNDKWQVGTAVVDKNNPRQLVVKPGGNEMVNTPGRHADSRDIYSDYKHGDALITLELMVPLGSNSGIYLQGEYEVQVLDSYGKKKMGMSDMGAIYGAKPAMTNACKKPGQWQKIEILFHAPKFDKQGKKVKNAMLEKVTLNGKLIQKDVELARNTPGGIDGKEKPLGPLMFQGNHGPVAYRNIEIRELPAE